MKIDKLSFLIGLWQGKGVAKFPTIETTEYLEELEFQPVGDEESIQFAQRTWYVENGAKGKPLHWEAGYIIAYENESFELLNAQSSKRVEVLKCEGLQFDNDNKLLHFDSKHFANDERMVKTTRDYNIQDSILKYEMNMATQKTPEFQVHLKAELKKI